MMHLQPHIEEQSPKKQWDRTAFDKLRATWSPERIAQDKRDLEKIFEMVRDSPLLAAALDWAKKHDIEFFVDRQAVNCGGYYAPGTGVMAIAAKYARSDFGMEVLGHELRHAWQDYHGLIAWNDDKRKPGDFTAFFINNAMIEADALAYGTRARDEIKAARMKKNDDPVPAWLQKRLDDENADLGEKFLSWFDVTSSLESHPQFYGDYFSKLYGVRWGVYGGKPPSQNFEFQSDKEVCKAGFDINDRQDVLHLGRSFSGAKNYLAHMQRDVLSKQIIRPSLADAFWGAANNNQKKLTADLRKAYIKETFAPVRVNGKLKATRHAPRHPWP